MRKRWKAATAFVAVALAVAALFWFMAPGMRIDPRRYRAIRFGMTKSEVETLLGAPPGDYGMRKGKHRICWPIVTDGSRYRDHTQHEWLHNDTSIQVWFDNRDRVRAKALQIVREGDTLDRIRDWIDPPQPGFAWLPGN